MGKRKTPRQKEMELLQKQEMRYLKRHETPRDSKLNQLLADKVPEKLQGMLEAAFEKAFAFVFEKGVPFIEKTYDKEELKKDFKVQDYRNEVKADRKSLRTMRSQAAGAGRRNTFASGAAGIIMGIGGVGLPDIPVFTGILFRSLYQTALKYGYSYESEDEKKFQLLLICGAVTYGKKQKIIDEKLNCFIETKKFDDILDKKELIQQTAKALSDELLYLKFLQGIPIIGAAGGAYDFKYMNDISSYAELKYRRRYYKDHAE